MSPAGRVLIDWDWGADGLWLVRWPDEAATERPGATRWGDLLSAGLRSDLQRWNDDSGEVGRRRAEPDEIGGLERRGPGLAIRVQGELGPAWEVLYAAGGAWHWIAAPQIWPPAEPGDDSALE